jgi:transcriptional regulator with XRE-family HTH domain
MRAFDGALLRRKREALGLSRNALGAKIGRSGQSVQDWEGGLSLPQADVLPWLVDALGCGSIDDLFTTSAIPRTGPRRPGAIRRPSRDWRQA